MLGIAVSSYKSELEKKTANSPKSFSSLTKEKSNKNG
jgi:hypothetical protein